MHPDPLNFEIDVDLSSVVGDGTELVSARWYKLLRPSPERPAALQEKIERAFRTELLRAQWQAALRRQPERRRAIRAPLLSRLNVELGDPLIACDISLSGLRASGRPRHERFDVEFKIPNVAFPIDAKVEVVSFKDATVIPLAGLRFVDIDPPYLDHINRYIGERRQSLLAA